MPETDLSAAALTVNATPKGLGEAPLLLALDLALMLTLLTRHEQKMGGQVHWQSSHLRRHCRLWRRSRVLPSSSQLRRGCAVSVVYRI